MGIVQRKEREREQRRGVILDAARNVICKHGLENCSMEKIAEEAELAKGTLYLYYRNRDEMMIALLAQDLAQLIDEVEKVSTSKLDSDKKLIKAVATFQKFSSNHDVFYKTITHLNMRSVLGCQDATQHFTATNFHDLNTRMIDLMSGIVQEGMDAGVFSSEKPARYVVMQMVLALKGIMVVTHNQLFPPAWDKLDGGKLIHDTALLMIKGLKCQQQQG